MGTTTGRPNGALSCNRLGKQRVLYAPHGIGDALHVFLASYKYKLKAYMLVGNSKAAARMDDGIVTLLRHITSELNSETDFSA